MLQITKGTYQEARSQDDNSDNNKNRLIFTEHLLFAVLFARDILSTLYVLITLVLTANLDRSYYYYPHFTDEETKDTER